MTAAGLLVDAVLHLQLAANYQLAAPAGIGQGNLFRIEAVLAILALLLVLLRGSRIGLRRSPSGGGRRVGRRACSTATTSSPRSGPIPAMYEPVWFFKKSLTAVAEAVAAGAALAGVSARQPIRSSASAANH